MLPLEGMEFDNILSTMFKQLFQNLLPYLTDIINDNIHNLNPAVEMCGVKILNLCKQLTLLACYRSPRKINLTDVEWDARVSNATNYDYYLLFRDFNAHHEI